MRVEAPIQEVQARAYTVPTDRPEADGTLSWDSTTLVLAEVSGGGRRGIGYTYADAAIVPLIGKKLAEAVKGRDAMDTMDCFREMRKQVRNLGRDGLASMAVSAVDAAIWDLKAKLLDASLALLLGPARRAVRIYGSGGFTTYSNEELQEQLSAWVQRDGCCWVKMKVGTEPAKDPDRVAAARAAIGEAGLFVDANGAYARKQAIELAGIFHEHDVRWFEEPVSSDDLEGLHLIRDRAPAAMEIAAGEYGWNLTYFRRMLEHQAVDVLQADATRCGGITGFMHAAALCQAFQVDLSGHCAPALHLHAACAAPRFRHLEWFHDHVRIERMFFDGAPQPEQGVIRPDFGRPGLGLEFRRADAERYAV